MKLWISRTTLREVFKQKLTCFNTGFYFRSTCDLTVILRDFNGLPTVEFISERSPNTCLRPYCPKNLFFTLIEQSAKAMLASEVWRTNKRFQKCHKRMRSLSYVALCTIQELKVNTFWAIICGRSSIEINGALFCNRLHWTVARLAGFSTE